MILKEKPEHKKLKCPECNKWSKESLWEKTEAYCEDCGTHPALICPKCNTTIDTIYQELEEKYNQ